MKHVVITPAHNEAKHLPGLVESMRSQTLRPTQWILVDDNSDDDTLEIMKAAAAANESWIRVLSFPGQSARKLGSKVARIVLWALERAEPDWDYFSKLDADIALPPRYYAQILTRFSERPKLGIASGVCVASQNGRRVLEATPNTHTRGAIKTYRRGCWNETGGFPATHGWDGIDGLRARRLGFETAHFAELEVEHRRPTSSANGTLRGRFVTGTFAHFLGYHPLFMAARGLRRMTDRPRLIGGAAMLAGFAWAYARGYEVLDEPETVEFLRREQIARLGLGIFEPKGG
ncbi:MAG: glycosyltransferase family A protein [Myxococcota bacterium]